MQGNEMHDRPNPPSFEKPNKIVVLETERDSEASKFAVVFTFYFFGPLDIASLGRLLQSALLFVLPDQTSITEFYLVKADRVR